MQLRTFQPFTNDGDSLRRAIERLVTTAPDQPGRRALQGPPCVRAGPFLIENTNNLGAGMARMHQERTTYYLLGYQPTTATMDRKFRRVSVKVKRPNVTVRARPGYLAQ